MLNLDDFKTCGGYFAHCMKVCESCDYNTPQNCNSCPVKRMKDKIALKIGSTVLTEQILRTDKLAEVLNAHIYTRLHKISKADKELYESLCYKNPKKFVVSNID